LFCSFEFVGRTRSTSFYAAAAAAFWLAVHQQQQQGVRTFVPKKESAFVLLPICKMILNKLCKTNECNSSERGYCALLSTGNKLNQFL
jgi:hypothetical protein